MTPEYGTEKQCQPNPFQEAITPPMKAVLTGRSAQTRNMTTLVLDRQIDGGVACHSLANSFVDYIATTLFETQVLMLHPISAPQNHTMGDACLRRFRRDAGILPPPASRPGWDQHQGLYA